MPRVLTTALVFFIGLTGAGAARAQDDAIEEARQAFRSAESAFDDGDHETALEGFRRAFSLSSRSAIRFNIAVCLEELGRYREAAEEYEQAALSEELSEEDVARARELARLARTHLGFVEASGSVGAGVLVDGTQLCTLPCRLELDPGPHELVALDSSGRRSEPTGVEVVRGESTSVVLDIASEPEPSDPVPPEPEIVVEDAPETEEAPIRGVSWLTWLGVGLVVAGGGAVVPLALYTEDLEAQYAALPTESTRSDGITAQVLTNVAIGVAAVGAILLLVDLLFLRTLPP